MTEQALMYRIEDAAAQVAVAKRRIEKAVASGEIAVKYPDSHPRISHDELVRWRDALPDEKPIKGATS